MSIKLESEVKLESEPCVVAWNNKLYVGCEDGFIRTFDANLSPATSWSAHAVQLFGLASSKDYVFSSSNDGGIRVWTPQGEKVTDLPNTGNDVIVLRVYEKCLYAGDEGGNVLIYEDNKEKAIYNVLEEVKDVVFSPPFLFTVRDLDVTVTEVKPDESKNRFTTQHTMEGRAPMTVSGKYFISVGRSGFHLQLHENSIESRFKKLQEVKISDMIINCLSVNGNFVWTGGWDGVVRCFNISENQLVPAGELNLGSCINGLVSNGTDNAYAVLSGGRVVNIKAA